MEKRRLAPLPAPAMRTAAPRTPARGRWVGLALAVALAGFPASAGAIILYQTGVGYRQPEFFIYHGDDLVPKPIDVTNSSAVLCPAPGTPNSLCGRFDLRGGPQRGPAVPAFRRPRQADGRRSDVSRDRSVRRHEDLRSPPSGDTSPTAPRAAFYFGLSGTVSKTASNPNVEVTAFSRRRCRPGAVAACSASGRPTARRTRPLR